MVGESGVVNTMSTSILNSKFGLMKTFTFSWNNYQYDLIIDIWHWEVPFDFNSVDYILDYVWVYLSSSQNNRMHLLFKSPTDPRQYRTSP